MAVEEIGVNYKPKAIHRLRFQQWGRRMCLGHCVTCPDGRPTVRNQKGVLGQEEPDGL